MKQYLLIIIAATINIAAIAQNAGMQSNGNSGKRKSGIKIGANFSTAHVKNAGDLKLNGRQGLMVSGFFSPANRGIIGYRSEIAYSRQGFEYTADNNTTIISSHYLLFPQLATININRFFQLQAGGQAGYLLSAKSKNGANHFDMKKMMNRIDYGAVGGIEIYPYKGLILGGRYAMSFGNIYKQPEASPPIPDNSFDLKARNGVISIFWGYSF